MTEEEYLDREASRLADLVDKMVYDRMMHGRKRKKLIKNYIILFIALAFIVYVSYVRFSNPELTETQLFLKMIGLL
jgi:hypothetical protein